MADDKNLLDSNDVSDYLADQDPQQAVASAGFKTLGRAALNAVDEPSAQSRQFMDPRQQEPGLVSPLVDPIDMAGGALGAKVGTAIGRDAGRLLGNEVGAIGDWEKLGYKMEKTPTKHGLDILVKDNKGNLAGEFQFVKDETDNKFFPYLSQVESEHQRKGIASEAYRLAEEHLGQALKPSPSRTEDAKALWSQPNRPFGKNVKKGAGASQQGEQRYAAGGEVSLDSPDVASYLESSAMPQAPSLERSPASEMNVGLDGHDVASYLEPELKEQRYGTLGQQFKTGLEGFAQGVAGPLAPMAEEALGVNPEDMRGRAETNPITHYGSEIGGLIAPALVSGGTSLAAKAAQFTQAGALEAVAKAIIPAAGETLASKIGVAAAKGALDNALISGSDEVSKMILQDPDQSAETAVVTMGAAALLGGGIGGVLGSLSPLWKATVGDKAGKMVSDFQGEVKFQTEHPEHVTALADELTQLHKSVSEPASEVYGANGLKGAAIGKAVPEMHEGMVTQAEDLISKFEDKVAKLKQTNDPHAGLLEEKLSTLKQGMNTTEPGELFNNLQSLKQTIQEESKFGKMAPLSEKNYRNAIKDLGHDLRTSLEDTKVWGSAAKLQAGTNAAFKAYLPSLQKFESTFMTKVPNPETGAIEMVINPGKVNTFINQLGKPNAEIKQTFLENFIKTSERYKSEIGKLYDKLGIESPIEETSKAVIGHALEAPTLGSKLAKSFIGDALGKGGSYAAGAGIGAATAAKLGLSKEVGALIGGEALQPFFKSILPALAKSFVSTTSDGGAMKAAVDYAAAVAKGELMISKAAKNVFRVESEVIPASFMPKENDHVKMSKALDKMQTNPEGYLSQESKLSHYLPNHQASMGITVGNVSSQLNSSRASTAKKAPLDSEPVPSPVQKAEQKRVMDIAQQPLLVLDKIKKGTVTAKDLATLGAMYPKLLNKFRVKLTDEMTNHLAKGEAIPYKTRIGLSTLLAQPLDSTMAPASIQSAQSIYAPTSQGGAQQQSAQPKGVKSSPALQKMPGMYATPGQASAARRAKSE